MTNSGEQEGKHDNGKQEIGERAGKHNRRTCRDTFVMESELFFVFGQVITLPGTGWVHVAKHLNVAAQWQQAYFPARSFFVVPAKQFWSKTD